MTPQVPKVVQPKQIIEADIAHDAGSAMSQAAAAKGRESFVSIGTLQKKAFTVKSSLLGA